MKRPYDPEVAAWIERHIGPLSASIYRAQPTVELSEEWKRRLAAMEPRQTRPIVRPVMTNAIAGPQSATPRGVR